MIVRAAYLVPLTVGKLCLYHLMPGNFRDCRDIRDKV